jgi:hypothetical protein
MESMILASDLMERGGSVSFKFLTRDAQLKDMSTEVALQFGQMVEVVAHREEIGNCSLDLIMGAGASVEQEDLFVLHVSIGSTLQPLLLHPIVSANPTIKALVESQTLKVQTLSSMRELCALLELLQVSIPPGSGRKVVLLLDRLDDLFGACLGDNDKKADTRPVAERNQAEKQYRTTERIEGGRRSIWPSDMAPSSDPAFAEGSDIPIALDKFKSLLASRDVAAVWLRSKYVQATAFGLNEHNEPRDGDKGTVLWSSSLRLGFPGRDNKPSPFAEAWKRLVPTVYQYRPLPL